jgi:hypothetical protein
VGRALGAGFRAVAGESWLAVLGMGVALFRGILTLPAATFVLAGTWLAVRETLQRGRGADAALGAVLQVWGSPRFLSIAAGLWLAGILLWGALRVGWVAGAMPLLAWRLSGAVGPPPTFSQGAAWRFHRLLPVAGAALLLDLAGKGMLLLAAGGAVAVGARVQGTASPGPVALVAALALATAAFLAAALSALGDVAVARAALAGEAPGPALRRGAAAFLSRPAAFLAAILAVWIAAVLATGSAQGALTAIGSVVRGGPRALLVVPEVMLAALAALVAAGAELWRLSAVGVLALAPHAGREARWMSLRSESLGIRPPSQ